MAIPPGDASNLCLASGGAGRRKGAETGGGEWEVPAFSQLPAFSCLFVDPRQAALRWQLAMRVRSVTDALDVACGSSACGRPTGPQSLRQPQRQQNAQQQRRQIGFALTTTLQTWQHRRSLQQTMGTTAGVPTVWIWRYHSTRSI